MNKRKWVLNGAVHDSSTSSLVSLFSDPDRANTTPWSCLHTAVLETMSLLKHLCPSHLPMCIQHLQRKWADFQPPVKEKQDSLLLSAPGKSSCARSGQCLRGMSGRHGSGSLQGSEDTVECRDTSGASNMPCLASLTWPELTETDQIS